MEKERKSFPKKEIVDWASGFGQAARDKVTDVATVVKVKREQAVEQANEAKLEKERKALRPVFAEDLEAPDYDLPPMICVAEPDEKHQRSIVCKDSLGFLQKVGDMQILYIYPDQAENLKLTFQPAFGEAAFYADNTQKDLYINLDEYFEYQKKARIDELEQIAFCLGAKHVEARLIERERTTSSVKGKASAKAGKIGKLEMEHDSASMEASASEVALCTDFDGNNTPVRPELRYFKNESSVLNLIDMRLSGSGNKIKSKTYSWDFSHSSGIQEKTAMKIESALKVAKIGINVSLVKNAATEKRTMLKYTIVF